MSKRSSLIPKRMAVALLVALSTIAPAWATSDAEATATAPGTQPAESQPATPAPAAAVASSEVTAQLEQLKQSVQAQAQAFAEHSQELENERAALRQEMDRIAGLEAKLGITPSEYVNRRRIAQASFQLRMMSR